MIGGRSSPRKRIGHEEVPGPSLKPLGFMITSKNQAGNAQGLSLKGSSRPVWKETGARGPTALSLIITTTIRATHTVPKVFWEQTGKQQQE